MVADPARTSSEFEQEYSVGPKLLMIVCWICAVLVVGGLVALLVTSPGTGLGQGYETPDIIGWITVAVFLLVVLWRFGQVRIFVSRKGVRVRNFFRSYQFTWPQILRVSMTTSDSWALLELSDGTQCLVLALPTSEGQATKNCVADLRLRISKYGETAQPKG